VKMTINALQNSENEFSVTSIFRTEEAGEKALISAGGSWILVVTWRREIYK